MGTIEFVILEQHDGRYIVVREQVKGHSYDRAETIVGWEADTRSTSKCYEEVSEWMISSGEYLDNAARITYRKYAKGLYPDES